MPRLTRRVFSDLAIWMTGFGLLIGLLFPPFCLLLGLPASSVMTWSFFASTLVAGVAVGAVNFGLARLVVGRRLRGLADGMKTVEGQLATAVFTQDWSGCEPTQCALPVDSDDEAGETAAAFNRLIGTLARSHAVEAAMRDFSAVTSREYELDALGASALDGLRRHLGAEAGAILVASEGGLRPIASVGLRSADSLADNDRVREVLRSGGIERSTIGDTGIVIDSVLVAHTARVVLAAPIAFKSVPLGVVVLATSGDFDPDTESLLDVLRADLGLAVNNALAHDRLERLAALDPLTDAYNRRFGLARLREEFSRAVRAEAPLGVLMLDLDKFKSVNDTYGHLVGDRLLRAVASTVRRVIREGDVLVRYGGEEFLVLLPGAGTDDLVEIGERIRRAACETTVIDGRATIRCTLSLGASSYDSHTDSPESLIAAADDALYEAKAAGRDRLVLAA